MHRRGWTGLGLAMLAACSGGGVTDPAADGDHRGSIDGVQFEARAVSATLESWPPRYSTFVELKNTTAAPVEVAFPDQCMVLLYLYDNPERRGEPVWKQPRQGAACVYRDGDGSGGDRPVSSTDPREPPVPCAEESERCRVRLTLPPGGVRRLGTGASAPEIMGDSIPSGRYHAAAVLRPNGRTLQLAAGTLELAR